MHIADKTLALLVYEAVPCGYVGTVPEPIPIVAIGNRLLQPKNDNLALSP